jgi:hypothetical protein
MIEANFLIPQNAGMCVREREEIGKKDDTHTSRCLHSLYL